MKRLLILALVLVAGAFAQPAMAAQGEIDLTTSVSGFTPGQVYGPWQTQVLEYRAKYEHDSPGATIVNRNDHDTGAPQHSTSYAIDDYHDVSPSFFVYGVVTAAAGNILPTRSGYFEGDVKLGRSKQLVWGTGYGVIVNPNGVVQHYVNFGPSYYFADWNITARILPTSTQGMMGTTTEIFTLQHGAEYRSTQTLTVITGAQPPNGIGNTVTGIGQNSFYAGIDLKQYVNPRWGFRLGGEYERLTDRATGLGIYDRRAITLGLFTLTGTTPVR